MESRPHSKDTVFRKTGSIDFCSIPKTTECGAALAKVTNGTMNCFHTVLRPVIKTQYTTYEYVVYVLKNVIRCR